ncbi:beta-1,3-galactosyltransferase 2-like [Macrobrachium rosenbergii]|uniref:beta-1,3-galactosyltransferase 2-like n=1 Tax=Macrobrachium rosenbergii TaxID=79674 RepID=UPI0034D70B57
MDLNGVLTLIPWRRVIRLGRLSHCVLVFVVLCSFVKFSQFSLQPEEMYPGESHRKRKLFYETNKRNLTSPEERGPEPPAETRLLGGGGGGGGEEEGAENPILNRVYAWEDNNSSTSESFPYRYLINEEKACNEMTEIINIVPIAPSSVSSRKMIRELWASPKHQNISLMTTLFLVGLPPSGQLQEIINKESMDFHDIIQVEFVDSYLNLTLKTLSILHWTENFCPNASWILKSDEDVFVNSFALKDYLHHISNGRSLEMHSSVG